MPAKDRYYLNSCTQYNSFCNDSMLLESSRFLVKNQSIDETGTQEMQVEYLDVA